MNRSFFHAKETLAYAFTIVGSMIGAGFVTGKEIAVFFSDDPSLSALAVVLLLFPVSVVLIGTTREGWLVRTVSLVVSGLNVVLLSCMLSAAETMVRPLFVSTEKAVIFPILILILSFFICRSGMGAIGSFSLCFLPVALLLICILCIPSAGTLATFPVSPFGKEGRIYPLLYVGMNSVLSFSVVRDGGKGKPFAQRVISGTIASFFLTGCIALVLAVVCGNFLGGEEMPLCSYSQGKKFEAVFYYAVLSIGIFSSAVCSHYTLMKLACGKTAFFQEILLSLSALALSRVGFGKIVETFYPAVGTAGLILLLVLIFLRVFSPKARRKRTFPLQERRG